MPHLLNRIVTPAPGLSIIRVRSKAKNGSKTAAGRAGSTVLMPTTHDKGEMVELMHIINERNVEDGRSLITLDEVERLVEAEIKHQQEGLRSTPSVRKKLITGSFY